METGVEVLSMERGDLTSLMEIIMLVILKKDTKVEMVKLYSKAGLNLVVFGKMIELLDKGRWFMQTEINFQVTIKTLRKMAEANIFLKVEQFTKETSKMTSFMEQDCLNTRTMIFMMVSSLMD